MIKDKCLYFQAKPGQQINISIYDFTSASPPGNTLPEHVHTYVPCFKYAVSSRYKITFHMPQSTFNLPITASKIYISQLTDI